MSAPRAHYLSFININRAYFCTFNNNIGDQFKLSNLDNMTGWNFSMSIRTIFEQLEHSYGKPNAMALFHNNTLFRSAFPATGAPEMLFHQIKQCQEIQTIAQDPYTHTQFINNAVQLLMLSGIFVLKEFNTWEAMTVKSYPLLKTFIHEAYARHLTSIQMQNTGGGQGYIQQNMYNILDINGAEDTDDDMIVTVPGADRVTTPGSDTTGSTYVATNASTITTKVTMAINQLAANQTHILQQMAAISVADPPPHRPLRRRRSISRPSPTWQSPQGGFSRKVVQRGVADVAEDLGDAGSAWDAAEIPLQRTWRPLAVAGWDSISPHLADKPVSQEPRSPTHAATTAAL